jgi:hypothetical protein
MLEGYHEAICKFREVEKEHDTDLMLGTMIVIAVVIVIIIIFIMWVLFCYVCGFM